MREWINVIPHIPVQPDLGTPFFAARGALPPSWTAEGMAHTHGHIVWRGVFTPPSGTERVDLDQPNGFAWALRCLLSAIADEDEARKNTPAAWEAAQGLWQDFGVASGLRVTDNDRLRLAKALAEVFA